MSAAESIIKEPNSAQPAPRLLTSRLPAGMIVLVLLLIATHAALTLSFQPAAYWLDHHTIKDYNFSSALLARGPWVFGAGLMLYLLVVGLALARLPRAWACGLAGGLLFFHQYCILTLTDCQFAPFFYASQKTNCSMHRLVFNGAVITLWVVTTFNLLFPHWLPEHFTVRGRRLALRRPLRVIGVFLAAAWLALMIFGVARSASLPATGWRPLAMAVQPAPRSGMAVAYDTTRNRAVLFGGWGINENIDTVLRNDTWEWDGSAWVEVHTETAPPGRTFPSMAYDPRRGVVVLYGGKNSSGYLNDVWEYNGKQWTMRCPSCNPAARWGATMLYDADRQAVVLYGGVGTVKGSEELKWYTEAWAWNGEYWSYDPIDNTAPATFNPAVVYQAHQNRILAFIDDIYGGAWVWHNRQWSRPHMVPQPPYAAGAALVYDPLYQRTILFGGIQHPGDRFFNHTWVLTDDRWSQMNVSLSPDMREGTAAFYDPTRRSMILFGGKNIQGLYLNDTWELPLSNETVGQP